MKENDKRRKMETHRDFKHIISEKGVKMTEAQRCLHHIAENMRMDKSISKEGYEYFQQAIKALEQQPCEDAINREDAINKIEEWADGFEDGEYFSGKSVADAIRACGRIVAELPTVTPSYNSVKTELEQTRWIPVSERLPENKQRVLVTRKSGAIGYITWNTWWNEQRSYPIDKVIAWMPCPEPYKAESEVTDADSN